MWANRRRGDYAVPFASVFAISRVQSMTSFATGLSSRFFRVRMLVIPRVVGRSTGKTLNEDSFTGKCSSLYAI